MAELIDSRLLGFRLLWFKMFDFNLLGALPASFDDAHGDGIEDEGAVAVPLRALNPADGGGIRGRAQLAAGDAAEVIGDDVVIADAAVFTMNAIEQLDEFDRLDEEAGFLADFADDASGEGFADFEHAAGEGPVAFKGLSAAANQKHAGVLHDDGADAYERRLRKLAFDDAVHSWGRVDSEATSQFCHGRWDTASHVPKMKTHPWGPLSLNTGWVRIARVALSSNKYARERNWLNSR
jgi:hypothetical protein